MMHRPRNLLVVATIALLASAYAGSRDAYFAGVAGPYNLRVVVHTPGVIPGLADITVALPNPEEITRVSVQPIFWNVPAERAPAPDIARRAEGGEFHANLWLMVSGSYGVRVKVQGSRGDGTVVVPVSAVAYQRLEMSTGLRVILLALAAFLGAGLVTMIRSAARESTLPATDSPSRSAVRKRGWIGLAAGSLVVLVMVTGGWRWWSRVDEGYRGRLYRSPEASTTVVLEPAPALRIEVRDSSWVALRHEKRPLVADEQKFAHVFLIGDDAFAHLHPTAIDSNGWTVALPPLPSGSYRLFAEVVDSSGFTETLTSTANIPAMPGARLKRPGTEPDGFWFVDSDQRDCVVLSDEYPCHRMKNETSITLRTDRGFAFSLRTPADNPVPIDWSVAEAADVLILKPEGDIVHLRPYGTMPAAAVAHFGGTAAPARSETPGDVDFPYPLPRSEGERVWVSVHAGGKRMVAVFDLAAGSP